jgi:membrane-associated phospholipid phosphatase
VVGSIRNQLPAKSVRRFTFVDYATLGYVGLVGLMVLFVHGNLGPFWPYVVLAHAVVTGLIYALVRYHGEHPRDRVTTFLRSFYPMLLYGAFYWETGKLNHMFFPGFLDPYFIRLEGRLFGLQPSLAFMDRLPYAVVSELFYAAYFSYYLMIAGVALALYLKNRAQFFHYVSVTSFVFYVCYLAYIVLPVVGPLVLFRNIDGYRLPADIQPATALAFPAAVQSGPFSRLMVWVYYPFETPGASFPSSHVAIAIVTVYFSFLYLRRIRWPHFVAMILLCAATVYCRYHYVVDVVGGVLTAALIPLGNRLYYKFGQSAAPLAAWTPTPQPEILCDK